MERRALTGYVCISANMVKSAPKCCCASRTSGGNCRPFFLLNSSLWTLFHEKMSREEDHKTLQEECKDAKVAFLRRRKIDRERRVHEVEGRPQAGFCKTVPGVQGGTGKAVESSPRQQRFKASRGNNQAKGKAPWNLTETDSSKTCQ